MIAQFLLGKRHPDSGRVRLLNAVIRQAWKRVPAYNSLWNLAGLRSGEPGLQRLEDLDRYPLLNRARLGEVRLEQRMDSRWPRKLIHTERSGGSTGTPIEIPIDPMTHARRQLRFLRALMNCGYRPGDRLLMLSARPTGRHPTLPGGFCVDLAADQETMARIYRQMRPGVLYGPLNALLLLARELGRAAAATHRPRLVVSTAESLSGTDRDFLNSTFDCDPADFYGMSECGLVAWRIPGAESYRFAERDLHAEFLPIGSGEVAERLIITDLHAGGCHPLIRYETGDLVERTGNPGNRRVLGFRGRTVDCLHLPGGRLISPYRITLLLESQPDIRRYQITQRVDLSLDVTIWAEPQVMPELCRNVQRELSALTGRAVPIRIGGGDGVPGIGQRKFRPVRSEVEQGKCAS
ncbi:phenylacetate-coenzyme A ligase PaaK-like adenylate-forming protein [Natronocella acetinitrilica]|uniref:Phenylacetate-coenzyme A ligase PaaK-like adenylate-forming protein n=1 Tax=Natronocella acetinitrilica TaxID=414046 RepID=A0AAE3G4Q3_9GAMM|nr:hypothetical protein [Natronocella acetinitrilica]MCP1675781.1 phenylacetate-coenzyme A ligase PaaK-like adenylate-forming protein [Natronocella acetinitrilica]